MTHIRFHKSNCRQDTMIFDSMYEAETWADSICNEIYASVFDGYMTFDYKVAYALAFLLAEVTEFHVRTEKIFSENKFVYKVWVIRIK
ncbi:hypothetical protein [Bacillus manliponensis]|uniref:hypothetical protein n=1 Tax=Bacillus manliponensis TaxID=574376 RepID=UPI00351569D6